jgi:hypothetical protein
VVEGLNEQGGTMEVFPRLQTQTQTNRDKRPLLKKTTNLIQSSTDNEVDPVTSDGQNIRMTRTRTNRIKTTVNTVYSA